MQCPNKMAISIRAGWQTVPQHGAVRDESNFYSDIMVRKRRTHMTRASNNCLIGGIAIPLWKKHVSWELGLLFPTEWEQHVPNHQPVVWLWEQTKKHTTLMMKLGCKSCSTFQLRNTRNHQYSADVFNTAVKRCSKGPFTSFQSVSQQLATPFTPCTTI